MNPYLIIGFMLAVMASGAAGYIKGEGAGEAKIQQAWDQEKADQLIVFVKEQDAARAREQALQTQANNLRQEKDREIRNISARAAGLAASLQQRAERTTQGGAMSGGAGPGQGGSGCTGSELYRSDATFLAREAERGDQLRAALAQCYAQYETLRTK